MKKNLKRILIGAAIATLSFGSASAGELLVYSSTDADNLKYYMDEMLLLFDQQIHAYIFY